jgi:hypothetical protein
MIGKTNARPSGLKVVAIHARSFPRHALADGVYVVDDGSLEN